MENGFAEGYAVGRDGNNNGGMFGGYNDWIWIIVLFALWQNGGFGNGFGGGRSGAMDNYVLTSDFSQLSRQISDGFNGVERRTDSIINGLCDGFYTQAQLVNGVNTNIMQGNNAIQSQLASCCCDLKTGIADLKYSNALNTRDLIENQNANYRALHEEIVANKIEAKNERIAELQAQVNSLQLKASQEAQNAYLLNELKPCGKPAYIVPNPNCCYNYNVNGVGYANGGCCNG